MIPKFGSKFRVIVIAIFGIVALIAFQNCAKKNTKLSGSSEFAQDSSANKDSYKKATKNIDPPEDVLAGGSTPAGKVEAVPGYVSAIPNCFILAPAGQNAAGDLVFMAALQAVGNKTVFLSSGQLVLGGSSTAIEIPSSALDSESASMEFHVKPEQLEGRGISVKAKGPGWDVLIGECVL